jgi:serine protease Do
VQEGDIVVEIDGQPIKDRGHLQGIVEALAVDREYPLKVLREGEPVTLTVTLAAMPSDFTAAMQRNRSTAPDDGLQEGKPSPAPEFDSLGLQVQEVTGELRKQLELGDDVAGIVVTAVKDGSPAAAVGLQSGDIIEKVGAVKVATPDEFHAAVEKLSLDKGVALLVTRGQASKFVVLKSE